MDHEKNIRAAAEKLQSAIAEGRKAGLSIAWPGRPEDLGAIAISETVKVKRPAPAAPAAAPAKPAT
ncbi:hypothetical protein JQ574_22780 [Bradyrhizobium sp. AUGA SZCCT0158]|uniref:hypothetical protein n=1 Tax=Bradyrhizobium sp. AUGA SZCCT0158 TaxID=2807661 RepID=UPI001BAE0DD1|nr:hypothetical protein [Bradyrhizobium sp. AUGA SZCCT0158]MBR1198826.1 hypothetical protein [Bradyrhizobium sp. AUGA SZCCT0158]